MDNNISKDTNKHIQYWDITILKQSIILSILEIVSLFFMMIVMFPLIEGIRKAPDISIFSAIIEELTEILDFISIFGLMFFVIVMIVTTYMYIAVWRKRHGLSEANKKYEETVYWLRYISILFVTIGAVLLLMRLLFLWSGIDAIIEIESLVIAALASKLVLCYFYFWKK